MARMIFLENSPRRDLKEPSGYSSPSLCPKAGPIIPRPFLTNVSLIFSCETDVNGMITYVFLMGSWLSALNKPGLCCGGDWEHSWRKDRLLAQLADCCPGELPLLQSSWVVI